MAAETFKGGILPGIVGSLFSLLVGFVLIIITGAWTVLMDAADTADMIRRDEQIQKNLDTYKSDHAAEELRQYNAIIREFDEVKAENTKNRDMIIDVIENQE